MKTYYLYQFNRYRRGLETCPQAKTSKSGHAIFYWPLLTSGSYNRQAKLRSDCDTYFSYHLKIITKSLILSEPVLSIYKESEKLLGQLLQDDLIGTRSIFFRHHAQFHFERLITIKIFEKIPYLETSV